MNALVQIFARAPVIGQVKTRLQPAISATDALAIYRQLLAFTFRQVAASGLTAEIWMQGESRTSLETAAHQAGMKVPIYRQRGADLGERMDFALRQGQTRAEHVMLIGSDCIDLAPARLQLAGKLLAEGADLVLGPSADGGYYLVAPADPDRRLFNDVEWGTARVWEQTMSRVSDLGWQLSTLPVGHDLDLPADLPGAISAGVITEP